MRLFTKIRIGARDSLLSRAQVEEIKQALRTFYPKLSLQVEYIKTVGDRDLKTSLRRLDKTDFFTKEIDEGILNGVYQIGIHSAKDLPVPLPKDLALFALTKGLTAEDALVFRKGENLKSLPPGSKVATSSLRREEVVKNLRKDLTFIDLRGTIHQRLEKLQNGEADAVVVAEAALIRLKLTHLNRMILPGATVPYQGRLAIVGREDDAILHEIFKILDADFCA